MTATTFYWHDYETTGADPSRDRPVQFAGLRTDADLNVLGDPLVVYARPARDLLPQPRACLVTGISPLEALEKGLPEYRFVACIHEELARPGTCGVGYNSLRFDDEVTRYALYRNFYDPYAREWQNGNSRWDIIDMVRAANALRPEGIEWPRREDGLPSFRLEDLTTANGIAHEAAHDALSDVRATIALARLVRDRQPRLYDYVVNHRDKQSARSHLDIAAMKPVLHISGMFGAARHHTALIVPLAPHPVNRNEIICFDLSADPRPLFELEAGQLRERLYTRGEALPEGVERPGIKSVHINKCPILVTAKMADAATAERLGLDGDSCRNHLAALRDFRERHPGVLEAKLDTVFREQRLPPESDPERMLYGGFVPDADRRLMERVRACSARQLAAESFPFEDPRLPELLFRYRARNFPDSLSTEESARWEEFRFQRLTDPEAGASICLEAYQAEIEALLGGGGLSGAQQALLQELLEYGDSLLA